MMVIRKAENSDFEAVCGFYRDVCEAQKTDAYGPNWHYGIYPSENDLLEHIRSGEMYLGIIDGEIAAAMVLVRHEDDIYKDVNWKVRSDNVTVLHLFAVKSKFRGSGAAKAMIDAVLHTARECGSEAVHLDIVKGNLPAEKVYRRAGFAYVETLSVWYEDTGDMEADLFEYALRDEKEKRHMEDIVIRKAERADVPQILEFIRSLAVYEKMEDQVVADEKLLEEWIFDKDRAEVLLASYKGEPAGFALYFHNFSTFLGRAGIYLEDLFVKQEYRDLGIGTALLKKLAETAVAEGCGRLEWSCLDWNEPSIGFYKSLGAVPMDDWTVYRVTGEALKKLGSAE